MSRRACAVALLSFAAVAQPALAQDACVVPRLLGVEFTIDNSGSMSGSDPTDLRLAAVRAGIDQMPDGAIAAVSSFDSSASSSLQPTVLSASTREQAKDAVVGYPGGGTDYEAAFAQAAAHIGAMPAADKKAVVFLSDGEPNTSDYAADRPLAAAGVPIYTIGFGSAPPEELAAIAARSGGQAFVVRTAGEAQAVFARIISTLTCDASKYTGTVDLDPGQTRTFPFDVAAQDGEFKALAAWSGGDVAVTLTRPDGSAMAAGSVLAGETFVSEPTYVSAGAVRPASGGWTLNVTASADNIDTVSVSIDVWKRTLSVPQPPVHGDPPGPPARPRFVVRAFGDSYTAAFGMRAGDDALTPGKALACAGRMPTDDCDNRGASWADKVASGLDRVQRFGRDLDYQNVAVSGTEPSHWLTGTGRRGELNDFRGALAQIKADKPNLVLLTLGANDILENRICALSGDCSFVASRRTETQMRQLLSELVAATRGSQADIYLMLYPNLPVDIVGRMALVNDALTRAARGMDAVTVVRPPSFLTHPCGTSRSWLLLYDGCTHPNEPGHRQLADAVLQTIAGKRTPPVVPVHLLDPRDSAALITGTVSEVAVKVVSAGTRGARNAWMRFVAPRVPGRGRATAAGARDTVTRTVKRRVRYSRGQAILTVKVPRAVRTQGTKVYLQIRGRRADSKQQRLVGSLTDAERG